MHKACKTVFLCLCCFCIATLKLKQKSLLLSLDWHVGHFRTQGATHLSHLYFRASRRETMKMCPGSAAAYLSCYCIFLRGADSLGAAGRVWCVCVCPRLQLALVDIKLSCTLSPSCCCTGGAACSVVESKKSMYIPPFLISASLYARREEQRSLEDVGIGPVLF